MGLDVNWFPLDSWIVITSSLAAAACAIPGCYLYLRKQSMIADALTHAALPGVVGAFAFTGWLFSYGWISHESEWVVRQLAMFVGAVIAGLVTALLTQWVSHSGWVRGDAALGAVFTTLFAIGLIMLRQLADQSDVDLDCVLYGQLETIGLSHPRVPTEAWVCAGMLVFNVVAVAVLYKELMITTFDPELAGALGFRPMLIHYGLLAITTTTLVTAFEVVGSILVIGMLVIPPATASFLTHRLRPMLVWSVFFAVAASVLGHVISITLSAPVTRALGLPVVESVRTSGMIVVVAGLMLVVTALVHQWIGSWHADSKRADSQLADTERATATVS